MHPSWKMLISKKKNLLTTKVSQKQKSFLETSPFWELSLSVKKFTIVVNLFWMTWPWVLSKKLRKQQGLHLGWPRLTPDEPELMVICVPAALTLGQSAGISSQRLENMDLRPMKVEEMNWKSWQVLQSENKKTFHRTSFPAIICLLIYP